MGRITASQRRAQIELIAKKLSQGYTDSDCMIDLKIKRATFYNYKSHIFDIWGNLSQRKSEQSIAFEADLLKDRLIRLHRMLDLRLHQNQDDELGDIAEAANIAAQIAIAIFKLEYEGFRMKELRGTRELERQAVTSRLLNSGTFQRELSEPDFTPNEDDDEQSNEPSDGRTGETEEKVY